MLESLFLNDCIYMSHTNTFARNRINDVNTTAPPNDPNKSVLLLVTLVHCSYSSFSFHFV